jgi:hypothetical protein
MGAMNMPLTPELDKQRAVIESGASNTLTEFYDWLRDNGYQLAKWGENDRLYGIAVRPEQLFADFFGIDPYKIELERRAILDALREGQ